MQAEVLIPLQHCRSCPMSQSLKKIEDLQTSLQKLGKFMKEKSALEDETRELKELRAKELQDFQKKERMLRKKLQNAHAVEKVKMQAVLKERQEEMQARMQEALDSTTKRTINENLMMQSELTYQSERCANLMRLNDNLLAEKKRLRSDLSVAKGMTKDMGKKMKFYESCISKFESVVEKSQEGGGGENEGASGHGGGSGAGGGPRLTLRGSKTSLSDEQFRTLVEEYRSWLGEHNPFLAAAMVAESAAREDSMLLPADFGGGTLQAALDDLDRFSKSVGFALRTVDLVEVQDQHSAAITPSPRLTHPTQSPLRSRPGK